MPAPERNSTSQEQIKTALLPLKNAVSSPTGESEKHEEHLLDKSLEATFPASDPIAVPEHSDQTEAGYECVEEKAIQHEEFLLDEALNLTFPASDPVSISDHAKEVKVAANKYKYIEATS